MSESLPDNWAAGTLGDAVQIVRGISFPSEDKKFEPAAGLVACLRTTNVQRDVEWDDLWYVPEKYVRRAEQEVQVGDILISTANSLELVGKVSPVRYLPYRATLGAFISLLRPSSLLNAGFVYYQITATEYQSAIRSTASTTTNISNVSTEKLRSLPFRFAPIEEQNRIVSEIEKQFTRLDAAVAALKRVQANLKRYRATVLKAACEGHLVPTEAQLATEEGRSYETGDQLLARILKDRRAKWEADQLAKMRASGRPPRNEDWKKKYKEPPKPDASKLPKLPNGWIWASVEMLSTKVVDGVHKKPDYVDHGVPFVTVRNLTAGPGIDLERLNHVTESDHAEFVQRANPEKGDILVSKDGTLGVIRAIRTDQVFSIFVSVAMIKPVIREMTDYLEVALSSPQVQVQMVPKGSGLQHIHLEDLREDCIPLPPFDEQLRVVNEVQRNLSNTDFLNAELKKHIGRADRLRQSILKRAFEGKLVPQDPNIEPATVLLERIRAERANKTNSAPKPKHRARQRLAAAGSLKRPEDFVCPIPVVWNETYTRLCEMAKTNGWEKPPMPLILAAWWDTTALIKISRWKETIEWAEQHGVAELVPELAEDQKHYIGD